MEPRGESSQDWPSSYKALGTSQTKKDSKPVKRQTPNFILGVLLITSALVNFDSGGTAAVLLLLSKGCDTETPGDPLYPCLNESDKGVLGAAPYVGLSLGCVFAGELLRKRDEKNVLVWSILLNALATLMFAATLSKHCMWAAKLLIGFTQSAVTVYAPVWCTKFAPSSHKTLWLGLVTSCCAVGTVIGYGICGLLVNVGVYYTRGFQFQACWLLGMVALLSFCSREEINVSSQSHIAAQVLEQPSPASGRSMKRSTTASSNSLSSLASSLSGSSMTALALVEEESGEHEHVSYRSQISVLLQQHVFVVTTAYLCTVWSTTSAIQYWIPAYLEVEFQRPGKEVTAMMTLVSGSAPILGVVSGSMMIDRSGGHKSMSRILNVLLLIALWNGVCSSSMMVAVALGPQSKPGPAGMQLYCYYALLWIAFFFGGTVIPASTGTAMATVPEYLRKNASSMAMLTYNVFGYPLGAYLPGCFVEVGGVTIRTALLLVLGVNFIASWGAIGLAYWLVRKALRER